MIDLFADYPLIKVEEFCGNFIMDTHSDIFKNIICEKHYEPTLAALCKKYIDPDKDCIDIGANVGFYSVLFAKTVRNGKVFSVEPTSNALEFLYKNLDGNGVKDKVFVFEGVVSDKSGFAEIKTIKGREEYSSISSLNHPSVAGMKFDRIEVLSITLNEFIRKNSIKPGFIKIDVEGAENKVIAGSLEILRDCRPVILCELSDYLLRKNGSTAKRVISMIKKLGYDVFDPFDPGIEPGWKKFGDIICFPVEMKIHFNQKKSN
jgi:FkbM family methyltransferase